MSPIIAFLNATPDRSPMTDWYQTKTARQGRLYRASRGVHADAL
ncbi:MAG: hypothetical protein WDM76_16695 [Limisphaerales bacterium]